MAFSKQWAANGENLHHTHRFLEEFNKLRLGRAVAKVKSIVPCVEPGIRTFLGILACQIFTTTTTQLTTRTDIRNVQRWVCTRSLEWISSFFLLEGLNVQDDTQLLQADYEDQSCTKCYAMHCKAVEMELGIRQLSSRCICLVWRVLRPINAVCVI